MNAVVKITVNEKALIGNLKMAFATGTTWVTELLQNARRAGATKIHIVLHPDRKEFSISDDGHGIEDMQHMFAISESGWDEHILNQERPYGMGFLSCLFACENIHIISRKHEAKVITKDALAFDNIAVEPHPGVEGTFIRMQGAANMPTVQFLQSAVKGFPVPVYLNQDNDPLESDHAVDAMHWAKTEIGLVHIRNLRDTFHNLKIYLQGLPIHAGFGTRYNGEDAVMVHLDPEKFYGRLPDRASVIDPDRAMLSIHSAIIKLYAERLRQVKVGMLAHNLGQEFVRRYGTICLHYCKDLLNDVPYLPNAVVTGYVADLDINLDNSVTDMPTNPVPMNTVADGTVKLFSGDDGSYDTENMPHMALIKALDGIIVDTAKLDSEHWVHPYVHHLKNDISMALSERQPPILFDGRFVCSEDIVLGDTLTLGGSFEVGGVLTEIITTYDETVFDSKEQTFYVPGASNGYGAVRQASNYLDDGDYCEDAFEDDDTLFGRLVSEARNPDPAALLLQLLLDIGLKRYNTLKEKSFLVTVGEDGAIKVILA